MAADTLEINTDGHHAVLDGNLPNGTAAEKWKAYVKQIRKAGEFGDELEILAPARKRHLSNHGIREETSRYEPASRPQVSVAAKRGKCLTTCDQNELYDALTPEWACKPKPAVPWETVAQGGVVRIGPECVECGRRETMGMGPFVRWAYCPAMKAAWPSHACDKPKAKRDGDRKLLCGIWESVKQEIGREPISRMWLATFVDAKVEVKDHKASLKILSRNSGGILTRMKDIQRLLVQTQPHLLLLQEARPINGNHNAFVSECRAVGYSVSSPRTDGLVCVCVAQWRRCGSVEEPRGGRTHENSTYRSLARRALDPDPAQSWSLAGWQIQIRICRALGG